MAKKVITWAMVGLGVGLLGLMFFKDKIFPPPVEIIYDETPQTLGNNGELTDDELFGLLGI